MDPLTLVCIALLLGSFLLAMLSFIATVAVTLLFSGIAMMIGYVLRPDRKARG
jgi:cbb3-type cytochrome oxidase subunit 3